MPITPSDKFRKSNICWDILSDFIVDDGLFVKPSIEFRPMGDDVPRPAFSTRAPQMEEETGYVQQQREPSEA